MKKVVYSKMLWFVLALWVLPHSVLAAEPEWTVNPHDYQYDMTLYFTLVTEDGSVVPAPTNNIVYAFVGDECRGVGEIITQTIGSTEVTYGYMRIRSNVTSGETVTFKYYNKYTDEVKNLTGESLAFASNATEGLPSNPHKFKVDNQIQKGDVNGDGVIDLTDVLMIFDYYMGEEVEGFSEAAADFDGDGSIDLADLLNVFDYYMNQ